MRALPPELKYMLVATIAGLTICAGLTSSAVWGFRRAHQLASFSLPGGHHIRLSIVYHWDIAHDVMCKLSGPSIRHSAQYVACIGAGQTRPAFTLHHAPDGQLFWITASSLPRSVLYAVDLEKGEFWPGAGDGESEAMKAERLLHKINGSHGDYKLHKYEWIGIKKPNQAAAVDAPIALAFVSLGYWRRATAQRRSA